MDHDVEKIFYLTKLEYMVLLGVTGIPDAYSFNLPPQGTVTRENAIMAMYGLAKRGLLNVEERAVPNAALRRCVDSIRYADRILSVIPGVSGMQKICFLSGDSSAIVELGRMTEEIRIRSADEDKLRDVLFGSEDMPWSPLGMDDDPDTLNAYLDSVSRDYESIRGQEILPLEEPLASWFMRENVRSAWELLGNRGRYVEKRYVFQRESGTFWIMVQTSRTVEFIPDSDGARTRILQDIGGRQDVKGDAAK